MHQIWTVYGILRPTENALDWNLARWVCEILDLKSQRFSCHEMLLFLIILFVYLHQCTPPIQVLLCHRCNAVNGNRWCSQKRHRRSSRELHTAHHTGRRFVSRCVFWDPDSLQWNCCEFWGHHEVYMDFSFLETWRRFKEEGENLSKASQTSVCEDGIREMVTFLNPRQIEGLCSP